jgi:RimJ/RimL family protein N-acetyltransferase
MSMAIGWDATARADAGDPYDAAMDATFDRLTTPRLVIRRFTRADVEAFARYRSDPEVARYQSWEAPYPIERARAFVEWLAAHHPDEPGEWFQLAVATREDPATLIGDVAFHARMAEPAIADIGYSLDPAVQGRGYALEAVGELVRHLFEDRGKHKVCADCDTRNAPSWRLLEGLGFRREGELRETFRDGGVWAGEYVYGLLDSEWRERATLGTNRQTEAGSAP